MNKKIIGALCCIVCIILAVGVCLNINKNKKYNYDSLQTFISDVSDNDIGKNITKNEPKFIVYKDEEEYCIDALEDLSIDQPYTFDNVILNLNGHNLTFENNAQLTLNNSEIIFGNINILTTSEDDNRVYLSLNNSKVNNITFYLIGNGGMSYFIDIANYAEIIDCNFSLDGKIDICSIIHTAKDTAFKMNNCNIVSDVIDNTRIYAIQSNGNFEIDNCNFYLKSNSNIVNSRTFCYAIRAQNAENCLITNSDIKCENYSLYGVSYGVSASSSVEHISIKNTDVYADSHYIGFEGGYGSISIGINSSSLDTNVDGCNVRGIHSGMQLTGGAHIINSHFESNGHGGVYFARSSKLDENGVSYPAEYYVDNSTLSWCPVSGISKDDVADPNYSGDNQAAFYIGGSEFGCNITVYMNECKIYGKKYSGVLRGTSNERFNTLYIKNTTLDSPMRIDNNTLEMYVQEGCNITPESEFYWNRKGITTYNNEEDAQVFFD